MIIKIKQLAKKLLQASATQAINSLTGFGLQIFLMASLTKYEFGLWGMAFAFIGVVAGFVGAYIGTQLVVSFYEIEKDNQIFFLKSSALASAIISFSVSIFTVVLLFAFFNIQNSYGNSLIIIVALSTTFYAFKDCLIRGAYCNGDEMPVFYSSIVNFGVISAVILVLWLTEDTVNIQAAILIYMALQIITSIYMMNLYGFSGWFKINPVNIIIKSWNNGRWSLLSSFAYNIRYQTHNFVVPFILGVTALAEVNAAKLFVSPVLLALPALKLVFLPLFSKKKDKRFSDNIKFCYYLSGFLFIAGLLYSVSILGLYLIFNDSGALSNYSNIFDLILAWCFVIVFLLPREIFSMFFQACKAFKSLMWSGLFAAVIAIASMLYLLTVFSAVGAILSIVISELVLLIVMLFLLRRIKQQSIVWKI